MSTEIELKAHVSSIEALKQTLTEGGRYLSYFEKDDSLWFPVDKPPGKESPGPAPGLPAKRLPATGLRIRREKRRFPDGTEETFTFVTYKNKEIRDGIEVNEEKEFEIRSSEGQGALVFEDLLTRLQLQPGSGKRKRGWAFSINGITAELLELESLGWFLELEILADNDRAETVSEGRNRLLELLAGLGIGKEAIEDRPYMQMLGDVKY